MKFFICDEFVINLEYVAGIALWDGRIVVSLAHAHQKEFVIEGTKEFSVAEIWTMLTDHIRAYQAGRS